MELPDTYRQFCKLVAPKLTKELFQFYKEASGKYHRARLLESYSECKYQEMMVSASFVLSEGSSYSTLTGLLSGTALRSNNALFMFYTKVKRQTLVDRLFEAVSCDDYGMVQMMCALLVWGEKQNVK